jgi:hypothetical protein
MCITNVVFMYLGQTLKRTEPVATTVSSASNGHGERATLGAAPHIFWSININEFFQQPPVFLLVKVEVPYMQITT